MAKSPAFFLLACTGTTLGVAALTTVSSVTYTALFRPLPYREPDRLVTVWDQLTKLGFSRFPISTANYLDYRAQNRVFDDIAAFWPTALTVNTSGSAERVDGTLASWNLLPLLGAEVARGRWFDEAESHRGQMEVAVVSDHFWRSRLGGNPAVIGTTIRVGERPHTIVGILKENFSARLAGTTPEVWLPALLEPGRRDTGTLRALARLRHGIDVDEARSQMRVMAAGLKERFRAGMGPNGEDGGFGNVVTPLREELFGDARTSLYGLTAASAMLLALGLTNTALLWFGRAAAQRREAAIRLALGASRARVARQFVMESLLPSLTGGVAALGLSVAALRLLNASPPAELAAVAAFTVNLRIFVFTLVLSAAAGLFFGAMPVRSLFRRIALEQSLLAERSGTGSRAEGRSGPVMVALQVGIASALLSLALLLAGSLTALAGVDPGFRVRNLMTAYMMLPAERYATAEAMTGFYRQLEERLGAWRGASRVALTTNLPLSFGEGGDPFSIEGRRFGTSGSLPQFAHQIRVGPAYLDLLQIPLVSGRRFDARDFQAGADEVAVVSERLVRTFWPHESPIGKRILMGAPRPGARWMTIVGIAGDTHTADLSHAPVPQIYRPFPQNPSRSFALIVDGVGAQTDIARIVQGVDPGVPVYAVKPMRDRVADSLARPRLRTMIFGVYGMLAYVLATFGIYSLALYAAIRRRREFAVRSALGASTGRLFGTMMASTLWPASTGATLGMITGYLIGRTMASLVFGIKPSNVAVYLLAGTLSVAAAGTAAWFGGRRLLRADPATILRAE